MKHTGTLVGLLTYVRTVFPSPGWDQPGGRLAENPWWCHQVLYRQVDTPNLANDGRPHNHTNRLARVSIAPPSCSWRSQTRTSKGWNHCPSQSPWFWQGWLWSSGKGQEWSYVSFTSLSELWPCSWWIGMASPQQDTPLTAESVVREQKQRQQNLVIKSGHSHGLIS